MFANINTFDVLTILITIVFFPVVYYLWSNGRKMDELHVSFRRYFKDTHERQDRTEMTYNRQLEDILRELEKVQEGDRRDHKVINDAVLQLTADHSNQNERLVELRTLIKLLQKD